MTFTTQTYGTPTSSTLLIQMVDDHDLSVIESEVSYIRELSGQDFCLKAVKVNDWNKDLSPWPAPAVFGNDDFGDGAPETLRFILDKVLPEALAGSETSYERIFLGGYSLAGLFALWAGYQTDRFDGIAAASPSVWFPGFTDYMKDNAIRTDAVYLSLGDREEKTRNPVMARVGSAIREAEVIIKEKGADCILEWNGGNHFKDSDLRTAKAFAWLMKREKDDIIEKAVKYITKLFSTNSGGHDAKHTLRVYHNAMMIAENEPGCDKKTVALAALLHDADDHKLFSTENNENARRFLSENGITGDEAEEICRVINSVSFTANRDKTPETPEGKIVQDADRLDALGAVGIARTFAFGGEHGRPMEESVQHFYDKLLLLKDLMNTKTGRELAEKRHAFLETFLKEYNEETGKDPE